MTRTKDEDEIRFEPECAQILGIPFPQYGEPDPDRKEKRRFPPVTVEPNPNRRHLRVEWPYVIQLRRTGGNRPVEVRTKPEGPDESHEVPAHISERINVERTAGLTARFPGRVRGRASAQGLRWHPSLWTWRRRTHQAPRPNREGQRPNWLLSGHLIDAGRVRTTSPQRRRPPVRREPPRNNGVASARQDAKPRDIGSGPGQRCEQPQNRPTAARWAGRPAIRQPAGPLCDTEGPGPA